MTDFLVQFALSNLLVSAGLALGAYAVHRRGRYPVLAHLLWVLVLAKLVTPPLLMLPVASILGFGLPAPAATAEGLTTGAVSTDLAAATERGLALLLMAWALGALVVLIVSLWRIYRFDRLLRTTSQEAPAEIQHLAASLAWPLGLRSAPTIYLSRTRLSPLTWWTGGRVRIVIPTTLPHQIGATDLRMVLAHELAHVKRRDYLVRWLEWLACVSFWWNPVVWWTRRNLHEDEEASCDALVLERLGVQPRAYANALLTVVEFLSGHAHQPPAVATGIDGRGSLEQRLLLIISSSRPRTAPRWLVVGVVSSALILMPFGIGSATNVPVITPTDESSSINQQLRGTLLDDLAAGSGTSDDDGFAVISGELSDAAAAALSGGRETRSARRAVKKALVAGLAAGRASDPAAKRAARKSVAKAKARLDKVVASGIVSRGTANVLLKSLRSLFKTGPTNGPESSLDEAIAAGLISPGNAATLLAES